MYLSFFCFVQSQTFSHESNIPEQESGQIYDSQQSMFSQSSPGNQVGLMIQCYYCIKPYATMALQKRNVCFDKAVHMLLMHRFVTLYILNKKRKVTLFRYKITRLNIDALLSYLCIYECRPSDNTTARKSFEIIRRK